MFNISSTLLKFSEFQNLPFKIYSPSAILIHTYFFIKSVVKYSSMQYGSAQRLLHAKVYLFILLYGKQSIFCTKMAQCKLCLVNMLTMQGMLMARETTGQLTGRCGFPDSREPACNTYSTRKGSTDLGISFYVKKHMSMA